MAAPTIMIQYQQMAKLVNQFEQKQGQVKRLHGRLHTQGEVLRGGAWASEAATKFYPDFQATLEGVQRLSGAMGTAGETLRLISSIFHQAEQQGRDGIPAGDGQGAGAGDGTGAGAGGGEGGASGGTGTGTGGGNGSGWSFLSGTGQSLFGPDGMSGMKNKEYSFNPKFGGIFPSRAQWDAMYNSGQITQDQYERGKALTGANQRTWSNSTDVGVGLYDRMFVDASLARYQVTGEYGGLQADFGNFTASASSTARWTDGKGELGIKGEAGAYLARVRGNVEYGALGASGDAGVGARATGEGRVVFDPKGGSVMAQANAEVFAGGYIEGSAGIRTDWFSVEGQLAGAAGAGAKGRAEVGFRNGEFTADVGFLASLGVGGGAGVKVRINVFNIWDSASSAVSDAYNAVIN